MHLRQPLLAPTAASINVDQNSPEAQMAALMKSIQQAIQINTQKILATPTSAAQYANVSSTQSFNQAGDQAQYSVAVAIDNFLGQGFQGAQAWLMTEVLDLLLDALYPTHCYQTLFNPAFNIALKAKPTGGVRSKASDRAYLMAKLNQFPLQNHCLPHAPATPLSQRRFLFSEEDKRQIHSLLDYKRLPSKGSYLNSRSIVGGAAALSLAGLAIFSWYWPDCVNAREYFSQDDFSDLPTPPGHPLANYNLSWVGTVLGSLLSGITAITGVSGAIVYKQALEPYVKTCQYLSLLLYLDNYGVEPTVVEFKSNLAPINVDPPTCWSSLKTRLPGRQALSVVVTVANFTVTTASAVATPLPWAISRFLGPFLGAGSAYAAWHFSCKEIREGGHAHVHEERKELQRAQGARSPVLELAIEVWTSRPCSVLKQVTLLVPNALDNATSRTFLFFNALEVFNLNNSTPYGQGIFGTLLVLDILLSLLFRFSNETYEATQALLPASEHPCYRRFLRRVMLFPWSPQAIATLGSIEHGLFDDLFPVLLFFFGTDLLQTLFLESQGPLRVLFMIGGIIGGIFGLILAAALIKVVLLFEGEKTLDNLITITEAAQRAPANYRKQYFLRHCQKLVTVALTITPAFHGGAAFLPVKVALDLLLEPHLLHYFIAAVVGFIVGLGHYYGEYSGAKKRWAEIRAELNAPSVPPSPRHSRPPSPMHIEVLE